MKVNKFIILTLLLFLSVIGSSVYAQTISQEPHGVISGGSDNATVSGINNSQIILLIIIIVIVILVSVVAIWFSKRKKASDGKVSGRAKAS